jgi:PAS domain S-box-containing protein
MQLHLLTLKFSGNSSKLEAPFLSDYYRASLPHIRISLALGTLFYAAFGILDALLMPEQKTTIWFIRFVIVCPVITGTLLASFSKSFERFMQPLLACVFILAGGGIICMIVIAPPPINYSYYAGLLLVFMWGYTFIRILFVWASFAGWVQVVLYEIVAIWISPTPFAVLLNNNFFFISASVIGMMACYSIEFYARRDFFLTRQLEIEREKVNKVNQELEERVEMRTADYLLINRALEQEIARHRQAEKALRESEANLCRAQEIAHLGSWKYDTQTGMILWSEEAYRVFGFVPGEVEITSDLLLNMTHPEDRDKVGKGLSQIRDGSVQYDIEYRIIRRDGSVRHVHSRRYVLIEKEEPGKIFGMVQDITDQKRFQEERIEMERRLLQTQKLESLGILAGGIAHDFNNLLMAILGNLELAMDEISPVSSAHKYLENCHHASWRAADLTRQMLAYSGKGRFVVEKMNLSELVRENIQIFRSSIPATIALNLHLNRDIPFIMADISQIQQVVMNLITNAAEAIGDNAGTITLSSGLQTCDVGCLALSRFQEKPVPGDFIYLEVTDTGCGMDEETQQKIFDPFFSTKFTGRGLGMSALQGIILGHKGAIVLDSKIGSGTTIRVLFPVSDPGRIETGNSWWEP